MTTNAAPASATTGLEGVIARLNDGGLKLEGQDDFLDFSRFGTPPPPGLAVGDTVRLVVKPGRDGRPKWIHQVMLAGVGADVGSAGSGAAPRPVAPPSQRPAGGAAWPMEDGAGGDDPFAGFEAEPEAPPPPARIAPTSQAPVRPAPREASAAGEGPAVAAALRALTLSVGEAREQATRDASQQQELLAQLLEAVQGLTVAINDAVAVVGQGQLDSARLIAAATLVAAEPDVPAERLGAVVTQAAALAEAAAGSEALLEGDDAEFGAAPEAEGAR